MFDFSKASEVREYFFQLLIEVAGLKKIGIYVPAYYMTGINHEVFMQDEKVYICFENKKCLVVDYRFVNKLNVEYRSMTDAERLHFNSDYAEKDVFNHFSQIGDSDYKIVGQMITQLEYGSLVQVEVEPKRQTYSAWINGCIEYDIIPTAETFENFKFVMSNQKSFCIVCGDSESDGYSLLWSDDAKITRTKF